MHFKTYYILGTLYIPVLIGAGLQDNLKSFAQDIQATGEHDLHRRGFSDLAREHITYGLAVLHSFTGPSTSMARLSMTDKKTLARQAGATLSYLSCQHELGDNHTAYPACFARKQDQVTDMSRSLMWAAITRKDQDIQHLLGQYTQHSPQSNLVEQFAKFTNKQ